MLEFHLNIMFGNIFDTILSTFVLYIPSAFHYIDIPNLCLLRSLCFSFFLEEICASVNQSLLRDYYFHSGFTRLSPTLRVFKHIGQMERDKNRDGVGLCVREVDEAPVIIICLKALVRNSN